MSDFYSPDADTRAELQAERRLAQRRNAALAAHPHPQDPDYPELPEGDEVTSHG
ncbi:hypothetical protein GN316_06520 [Xylophilus sp. Kf1]|nr:hypothetical protein [Xylophilus sp. Kf1]